MAPFNVSWNSGNKSVAGKVFARKRKSDKRVGREESTILTKVRKKQTDDGETDKSTQSSSGTLKNRNKVLLHKVVKKNNNASESIHTSDVSGNKSKPLTPKDKNENEDFHTESLAQPYGKLIKRKNKKDKQAAALPENKASYNRVETQNTQPTHSLFSVGHKDVYVKPNVKGKSVVEQVFSAGKNFGDLDIHKHIVSNLEKIGFTTLMTVQEKSIPVVLSGKNVLVRSQTGSGKTLAYAVPILNALQGISPRLQRSDGIQAIIIVPTRELALQTHELFGKINTFQWIVACLLSGGDSRHTEKSRLRKGVHILITTPGRLLDHLMHTASFKTNNVRCLVLDEADELLNMGFRKTIVSIVEELDKAKTDSSYDPMALLKGNQKVIFDSEPEPSQSQADIMPLSQPSSIARQTIMLSATMSRGIGELAAFTMKNHTYIDAVEEMSTLNPDCLVIPNTVKQKFIVTHVKHRLFTLSALLVSLTKKSSKVFVFMGTTSMVKYHFELFTRCLVKMPRDRGKLLSGNVTLLEGITGDSNEDEETVLDVELFQLHGNMDHSARKDVFTKFRAAESGILICSNVAARGIDVPAADCIIQYNAPSTIEDYLHRVGRTGRAGKHGTSYIFLTHEEQDFVTELEKHKVYLQEQPTDQFLEKLCVLMKEEEQQKAATALQKHYENALAEDEDLHKMAFTAYSSWCRFYNSYSSNLRHIFEFKNANLGHYVSSFGLKETPTHIASMMKGQLSKTKVPRLNKELATHDLEQHPKRSPEKKFKFKQGPKRKIKSISLTTSEFSSGLKLKKKKKKNIK